MRQTELDKYTFLLRKDKDNHTLISLEYTYKVSSSLLLAMNKLANLEPLGP